jgi:hypothetical protein
VPSGRAESSLCLMPWIVQSGCKYPSFDCVLPPAVRQPDTQLLTQKPALGHKSLRFAVHSLRLAGGRVSGAQHNIAHAVIEPIRHLRVLGRSSKRLNGPRLAVNGQRLNANRKRRLTANPETLIAWPGVWGSQCAGTGQYRAVRSGSRRY